MSQREGTLETNNAERDYAFSDRANLLLFGLFAALFVALRVKGLTASCLWFDEIFSVHAASHGWSELFSFVAADLIHPPLFYVLLKVWIAVGGESLLWLRLFPLLASIAAIVPFCLLCREIKLSAGARNLAFLLLAISGFLIKYAQEVRMYSLLFFFSLCSLWLFVKFIKANAGSNRSLAALSAVNLLLVYTHYAGWMLLALEAVALLVFKRERLARFSLTVAAQFVLYIPWIYELYRSAEPGKGLAQNIGWVSRPGLREIVQSLTTVNRPVSFSQSTLDALTDPLNTTAIVLIIVPSLIALVWSSFRAKRAGASRERNLSRALVLFSFAPALFFFAASWVLPQSVWGTRHLIISAGPYAILLAIALRSLRPYWLKVTMFLLLGCWILLVGTFSLFSPAPNFTWCSWEPLAQEMVATDAEGDQPIQVYAFEDLVAYHLWFGANHIKNSGAQVSVIKNLPGTVEDPAYFLPRRFPDVKVTDQIPAQGDSFWIAFRARQLDNTRAPLSMFTERGFRTGEVIERKGQGETAFLVRLRRE